MSILGKILGRIWNGGKKDEAAKPAGTAAAAPAAVTPPIAAQAPQPATPQPVDVDAILDFMNEQRDQKLNWRTSIVDLMKLTGMDSTLAERRELAGELGYSGDTDDTAAMNIWLHAQVIERIKANGGQIRVMTD